MKTIIAAGAALVAAAVAAALTFPRAYRKGRSDGALMESAVSYHQGMLAGARYACRYGPALVAEREEHRRA